MYAARKLQGEACDAARDEAHAYDTARAREARAVCEAASTVAYTLACISAAACRAYIFGSWRGVEPLGIAGTTTAFLKPIFFQD